MSWNQDRRQARRVIWGVRSVVCVAIALTSSCAMQSRSSTPRPGTFVAAEYAPYDGIGAGEIEGRGSDAPELVPGPRASVAQRTVLLTPVTTWSQHWWRRSVIEDKPIGATEPRVDKYMHAIEADSSGHFDFKGLPEGQYYLLMSTVRLVGEALRPGSGIIRVRMGKRVAIARGEHASVVLDSLRTDSTSTYRFWPYFQAPDGYSPSGIDH